MAAFSPASDLHCKRPPPRNFTLRHRPRASMRFASPRQIRRHPTRIRRTRCLLAILLPPLLISRKPLFSSRRLRGALPPRWGSGPRGFRWQTCRSTRTFYPPARFCFGGGAILQELLTSPHSISMQTCFHLGSRESVHSRETHQESTYRFQRQSDQSLLLRAHLSRGWPPARSRRTYLRQPGPQYFRVLRPFQGSVDHGPTMNNGRWYPTIVTLPDGKAFVSGGNFPTGALQPPANSNSVNNVSQILEDGNWQNLTDFSKRLPLYPRFHVAPNGSLFMSGS